MRKTFFYHAQKFTTLIILMSGQRQDMMMTRLCTLTRSALARAGSRLHQYACLTSTQRGDAVKLPSSDRLLGRQMKMQMNLSTHPRGCVGSDEFAPYSRRRTLHVHTRACTRLITNLVTGRRTVTTDRAPAARVCVES